MDLNFQVVLREAIWRPERDVLRFNIRAYEAAVHCKVWGCYQFMEDANASPVFIIELDDGSCTWAAPEEIQFLKEDDDEEADKANNFEGSRQDSRDYSERYAKGGVIPL